MSKRDKNTLIDHVLHMATKVSAELDVNEPIAINIPPDQFSHLTVDERATFIDDVDKEAVVQGLRAQSVPNHPTIVQFYVARRQ